MKAVAIEAYGGLEKLKLMQLPRPDPAPAEILVKVKNAGVNPVDTMFREGYLQTGPFPLIQGSDFAGVVEAVGSAVTDFQAGDPVYGYKFLGNGTYAEYVTVAENLAAHKPPELSFEQAAGVPCAGLVAYEALVDTLKPAPGEHVLITASAGGVGQIAVQIAKSLGAIVIATASARNHEFVAGLGADHIIDYVTRDYVRATRKIVPTGVDVALAIAEDSLERIVGAVRDKGRIATFRPPLTEGLDRGIRSFLTTASRGTDMLNSLAGFISEGAIHTIHVDRVLSLEEAHTAQRLISEGHVRGKIIITVEG
jgi:NADPH:quinone reductase-like Zn-dependent oxidoreductase